MANNMELKSFHQDRVYKFKREWNFEGYSRVTMTEACLAKTKTTATKSLHVTLLFGQKNFPIQSEHSCSIKNHKSNLVSLHQSLPQEES